VFMCPHTLCQRSDLKIKVVGESPIASRLFTTIV
jgi:hypothetical protein